MKRRDFFSRAGGLTAPLLFPVGLQAIASSLPKPAPAAVNFYSDSPQLSVSELLGTLQALAEKDGIQPDSYGNGGAVQALEERIASLTGKEKAIYLPTGTMANQLAIKLLSGDNTKVFVQENSHVYRDEADASQSVHHKRLIPLSNASQPSFTVEDLEAGIQDLNRKEVFRSGMGAVSIENPIRRSEGQYVDQTEIERIAAFCRENSLGLHLDGARLFFTAAFSGRSIAELSRPFDTVYLSLYKYLGAPGGAILTGDAALIDKVPHLIKIYGGNLHQNWVNAAMALHTLEHIESQFAQMRWQFDALRERSQALEGLKITALPNGTNIFHLDLAKDKDAAVFRSHLAKKHEIFLGGSDSTGRFWLLVNTSLLRRTNEAFLAAFADALAVA